MCSFKDGDEGLNDYKNLQKAFHPSEVKHLRGTETSLVGHNITIYLELIKLFHNFLTFYRSNN